MLGVVIISQAIVIIWLCALLAQTNGGLKRRIDRASRHLQMIDKPEDPKPVCGCTHHQCFHDDGGCGAQETKIYNGNDYIPCGCKRYTGPEALPTVLP